MTNDRRKTFNTPLEFWQWAIMEPGKRKAKTHSGRVYFVQRGSRTASVYLMHNDEFADTTLTHALCPLTAVEDEHGAIEEEESGPPTIGEIATLFDKEHYVSAIDMLLRRVRYAIREEIAAAEWQHANGPGQWETSRHHRLKPKGKS